MKCKICSKNTKKKIIFTRSKKKEKLFYCEKCDFEFFFYNPQKQLTNNKLNLSRLKKAGLKIPKKNEEFKNGLFQSKNYLKEFIKKSDLKKNILEIGCSLGYFLFSIKKFGCKNIYGLEINEEYRKYVNNKLNIRCERNLNIYKDNKIFFNKIFLFYSFEYIPKPVEFLQELFSLLEKNGEIILITPNKNDVLKNILSIKSYNNFFYDKNSINYFSVKSLKKLLSNLKQKSFKIYTKQGYSFINFFNWFLNNKPIASRLVGEDYLMEDLLFQIKKKKKSLIDNSLSINFYKLFKDFNNLFKKKLSKKNFGNQIILKIKKNV